MSVVRRSGAAWLGAMLAAWPSLGAAAEPGERALSAAGDLGTVLVVTALGAGAVLGVAGLGYLYRRERGLDWDFQRPDPEDEH